MDRLQDAAYAILSSVQACSPAALFELCGLPASGGLGAGQVGGEIKLNGRSIQIIRLLGEGGFSFVYLARDKGSGREFALKKIRCSHGSESFTAAMKEIEAMRRFRSPNIIRILDSAVVQEADHASGFGSVPTSDVGADGGVGKTVYLFLPFYPLGNIQDAINRHVVNGTHFSEREMLALFLGTCKAVQAMHQYRLPNVPLSGREGYSESDSRGGQPSKKSGMSIGGAAGSGTDAAPLLDGIAKTGESDPFGIESDPEDDESESEEVSQHRAAAYPPKPSKGKGKEVAQASLGGESTETGQGGDLMPYAHRDIKPGNVMIAHSSSSDGDPQHVPILMDFGSATKARLHIATRREAVVEQDLAAERSTLPFRAPELFDVKTDSTLTEAVDIWSLGCTLYAMAYHYSPFETPSMLAQGASTALAVLNNKWDFPKDDNQIYSGGLKTIIQRCLVADVEQRADIDELIRLTEGALARVS
ncbi:unnamed protein product [Parajaminaea phylloscopi]